MILPIANIRTDGGTQPRVAIDPTVVDDYGRKMREGESFPAITVYYDGTDYWLADGFHRLRATEWIDCKEINCEIRQGTLQDAQWYSFSANKGHGLPRTEEDKQQIIKSALIHPTATGLSDQAIAKHIGCSRQWVSKVRSEAVSSNHLLDTPVRTVTRGGSTYRQDTTNIGRSRPRPELEPETAPASTFKAPPLPEPLSSKRVWAAQETKHFTREFIRLLKSYEKSHPPVDALTVTRNNGVPVGIEILSGEMREEAS